MNMAVEPGFSWVNRLVQLLFEGRQMVLQPLTEDLACTVSIWHEDGLTFDEAASIVSRFLSALAWSKDASLVDKFPLGTNNPSVPGRLGRGGVMKFGWASVDPWPYLYMPSVPNERSGLALALYREGLGLNSIPHAFLSFAKVLNVVRADGPRQKVWINSNLQRLSPSSEGAARIASLRTSQPNVAAYLWEQGRCATAHANGSAVNPDDYGDKRRLREDMPLMRELAALCIEVELGVERPETFLMRIRDSLADQPALLVPRGEQDGRATYVPALRAS